MIKISNFFFFLLITKKKMNYINVKRKEEMKLDKKQNKKTL